MPSRKLSGNPDSHASRSAKRKHRKDPPCASPKKVRKTNKKAATSESPASPQAQEVASGMLLRPRKRPSEEPPDRRSYAASSLYTRPDDGDCGSKDRQVDNCAKTSISKGTSDHETGKSASPEPTSEQNMPAEESKTLLLTDLPRVADGRQLWKKYEDHHDSRSYGPDGRSDDNLKREFYKVHMACRRSLPLEVLGGMPKRISESERPL